MCMPGVAGKPTSGERCPPGESRVRQLRANPPVRGRLSLFRRMNHAKQSLRKKMRTRRRELGASERARASHAACARLRHWLRKQEWNMGDLLVYRALREELDTAELFMDPPCPRVFAPVVIGEHLLWRRADGARWKPGAFSIPEPDGEPWDMKAPAVLVCPLVAFDRRGGRLGMGRGYFDRWIAHHRRHLLAVVGLAFALQEVAHVPMERHDVRLDFVITEHEVIPCR